MGDVVLDELLGRRQKILSRGNRFMGRTDITAFNRGLGLAVQDGGRGRYPSVYIGGGPSAVAHPGATRVIAVRRHARLQERLVQCGHSGC